jgi:predicted dehydrogenase
VLCDASHQAVPAVGVEDTVHIAARNGDALASYALNQFQPPNETMLQFNSERGSVRIEPVLRRWGVFQEGDSDWQWTTFGPADRDTPFIDQANAFLDQIEGQPTRLCSLEAGAQTLRFNLAALASAESGRRIFCRDV